MRLATLLLLLLGLCFWLSSRVYAVSVELTAAPVCLTPSQVATVSAHTDSDSESFYCGFLSETTPLEKPYFGCSIGEGGAFQCKNSTTKFDTTEYKTWYLGCYPKANSGNFSFAFKATDGSYTPTKATYNLIVGRFTSRTQVWSNVLPLTLADDCTASSTPKVVPQNIHLSEVFACPPTGQNEWVEISNNNDATVTLADWEIHDETTSNKQKFSTTIVAHGLATVEISTAMLNNNGDVVKLVDPNGNTVESFSYNTCEANESWSKSSSGTWYQTTLITRGQANQFPTPSPTPQATAPIIPTSNTTSSPKPTPTPSPSPDATMLDASISGEVLAATTEATLEPTPSSTLAPIIRKAKLDITKLLQFSFAGLVLGGVGLLVAGGITAHKCYNKRGKKH